MKAVIGFVIGGLSGGLLGKFAWSMIALVIGALFYDDLRYGTLEPSKNFIIDYDWIGRWFAWIGAIVGCIVGILATKNVVAQPTEASPASENSEPEQNIGSG